MTNENTRYITRDIDSNLVAKIHAKIDKSLYNQE